LKKSPASAHLQPVPSTVMPHHNKAHILFFFSILATNPTKKNSQPINMQHITKKLTVLITLLPVLTFAQSDFCDKSHGDSYYPLYIGFEKHLTWGTETYVESVKDTTVQNGITYYNYDQDFGGGKSYNLLVRKQNDTVFLYNGEDEKDIILLIERPAKGVKWHSGEVIDTDGFFESPYCDYSNLLVVENKYTTGTTEKRYYKKGLGLVAVTSKEGIKGMCVPSKEESKGLSKPLSAFECTDLATKEDIQKCTMNSMHAYLTSELQKRTFKIPKEEGILKFALKIDKTGKVREVEALNSLKGGNQITKMIEEILLTVPQLRPTMTSKTKSVNTRFELSVPIRTQS